MQRNQDTLGSCPECGEQLFPVHVLVEYETDEGVQYYAECPGCQTVVNPA